MSAPRDTEVEIRLATVADAPAIQAIYGPVVASTHISFELEPPTPDEMAARIAGVLPAHPWIVLTEGEELLGYAYAHHYQPRAAYRWSVETSIYVSPVRVPGPQGQGRGRGALPVPARGTGQAGLPASHCGNGAAKPDEHAAAQVARLPAGGRPAQAGVETRGWHDVAWWQCELVPGTDAPAPPVGVDRLPPGVLAEALESGLPRHGVRPELRKE